MSSQPQHSFLGLSSSSVLLGVSGLLLVIGIYKLLSIGRRDPKLPPGPPTIPILGNLHQIPITGIHKKFKEWGDQYGGVFSLKFGPGTMIVLFDRKAIHDLIDKKGTIYSERPANYVASLVTHGDSFPFMDSTPLWRSQRKVASHNLSPRNLDEKIAPIQDAEVNIMMQELLNKPSEFYTQIQRTTASVANSVVWGQRAPAFDNFWGHGVYDALDQYSAVLEPGATPPVDVFPFLKYVPDRFASWKARSKKSYAGMDAVWSEARRQVNARRLKGDKRDCIADKLLDGEKDNELKLTDKQTNHFLGVIVEGGADTTSSSVLTSLLYLAMYPLYQEKARKEIDEVCGRNRTPAWSDFKDLPYINCIVKEAMRIHPVIPIGVPHRVNQDDYYSGMLIPKDATVVIPAWALHFTEGIGYAEPEKYKPDRFLSHPKLANDYAGAADYTQRDHYGYGAGRRICPGIHLAERTQWRITARILWAFEVNLAKDAAGRSVELDLEAYKEGLNHCPLPFKIDLKPRTQAHIDTINREATAARQFVSTYE